MPARPWVRNSIGVAGGAAALACAFITPWEGRKLDAYKDIVGVVTICAGDTKNVRMGQKATGPECDARLMQRLVEHEDGMVRCINRTLPVKMHVAMLSATYNIGVGNFCSSSMARRINAGDLHGACDALLMWDVAGGKEIKGLARRRQAEDDLCQEGADE